MYDKNNVFAQIIAGKMQANKVYEDEMVLAFNDINPVAEIHVLVIPKGEYINYGDFINKASCDEIANYFTKILDIIKILGLESKDYKLITNKGVDAGQTIFHFHTHIIAGKGLETL
jgi:histidine triad (HIT) family protein